MTRSSCLWYWTPATSLACFGIECSGNKQSYSMLNDLNWDTLEQGRQLAKATCFIVWCMDWPLVAVPTMLFLILAAVSATRGHNMKYLIHTTVIHECTPVFLFPQYHEDLESATTAGCLGTKLRGLQVEDHHLKTNCFLPVQKQILMFLTCTTFPSRMAHAQHKFVNTWSTWGMNFKGGRRRRNKVTGIYHGLHFVHIRC